jgi:hypothetical protein
MNNRMRGLRPCFTANGSFVTFGHYNFKENKTYLKVNKIEPNKHLGSNAKFYNNNTKVSYLECLQEIVDKYSETNKNLYYPTQPLNINDYTQIILKYISNIEAAKETTDSTQLMDQFAKEIEILNLFKLLFLNNVPNRNYISSLRVDVKLLRKAKLTEWLVKSSEEYFNKNINKQTNKLLFNILSGRHDVAMKLCAEPNENPNNIIASLTSVLKNKSNLRENLKYWKQSGIYDSFPKPIQRVYEVLSSDNIDVYDNEALSFVNWKTLLISLITNTLSYRSFIADVIFSYEAIFSKFNKPAPKRNDKDFDLSYLLIKLLSSIETNNEADDIVKLLEDTNCLFDHFTNHHIQYTMVSILLNILNEAYYYNTEDGKQYINLEGVIKSLQKVHFRLLIKNVEEFLINDDWKHAVQLIKNATVSYRIRNNMIRDIFQRYSWVAESDETYLNINNNLIREAYAEFLTYRFNYQECYRYYILSEKFPLAFDTFIYHILYIAIINDNVGSNLKRELTDLSNRGSKIPKWNSHGQILLDYFFYTERDITTIDFDILEGLIRSVEKLTGDVGAIKITTKVKNILLRNLRKIYNKLAERKSTDDVKFKFNIDSLLYYALYSLG